MRRLRRWLTRITLAATAFLALSAQSLRRDELHCEEAKKHVDECCGGASLAYLDCTYDPGCGTPTYPDLDERTALCLRDASCDTLKDFCNAPVYLCR
jgi:hypothetical protein